MTDAADAGTETWGEQGPAMRALPNDKWRRFVRALVTGKGGHGSLVRAFRVSGFNAQPKNQAREAHSMSRDERVIAAIAEESRKVIRVGHPEAVAALFGMIRDVSHRDHARAVAMVLDRCDPVVTTQKIDVTHRRLDADQEALEELRAARELGATREKLLTLFGGNGLLRLERLEAVELERRSENAKIIEGQIVEARG
jgi:hypothetical protein